MTEPLEAPPHLSPSSMATYNQCPMKFRFSKIDKLPDKPTEATLLGNFVHDVCEQFYMYEPEERVPSLLRPLMAEVWNGGKWDERVEVYVPEGERLRNFKWRAFWCLENLWKVEVPGEVKPEGVEFELNGELEGVTLKGFIDRYSVDSGDVTISDYKTGKTPQAHWGGDKFLQLKIYGALINRLEIGETRLLELLYLKDGQKFEYLFTRDDFQETVDYVVATKDAVDANCKSHEFETRKTFLCNWCAYKPQCPTWR